MIKARIPAENPDANLRDYRHTYENFSWEDWEKRFTWYGSDDLNIAQEIDRWAEATDTRNKNAIIYQKRGEKQTITYLKLKEESSRWAHLFTSKGLKAQDKIFVHLPICPDIYLIMLGCARAGIIFCNLLPSLSMDEIVMRIEDGKPSAIITHPDLVEMIPLESIDERIKIFLIEPPLPGAHPGEIDVSREIKDMPAEFPPRRFPKRTPLYIAYTSGVSSAPKGVVHTHYDMVGMLATGEYVLDLKRDSILWVQAHPAWITGTVYSAFTPWLIGATTVVLGDTLLASRVYETIEKNGIDVWYTTPEVIRTLIEAGEDLPTRYDLTRLRHIATVGEPLGPEGFYWIKKNLGHSAHDTWWMTETGIICIANFPSVDIKPGAMGLPVPGINAMVVDDDGNELPSMSMGQLALKIPWPGLMSGIWGDEKRYMEYFKFKGMLLTGDMVIKDDEGYLFYQGRSDDLLKLQGERVIGPYEVEHILKTHPAVKDAAIISISEEEDSERAFKAFVSLKEGYIPSTRLRYELKSYLSTKLRDINIKDIEFMKSLPRSCGGDVLRRVLRASELGIPIGDISNLNACSVPSLESSKKEGG